jgi:hypothetical protein
LLVTNYNRKWGCGLNNQKSNLCIFNQNKTWRLKNYLRLYPE